MLHQHPGGLQLTKRLIDYCFLNSAAKVVDIGCGTGETAQYLRDMYGIDAVGIDVAKERLAAGKSRYPGLRLVEAAAENLPFEAGTIDASVAECSLSVMENTEAVIAEISRILVAGGKLALTDVYDKNPSGSRQSGFLTYQALAVLLEEYGFKILIWEDHSAYLAEFAACFIMKYGSIEKLWQCVLPAGNNPCSRQAIKMSKPGYFLLVAEKYRKDLTKRKDEAN